MVQRWLYSTNAKDISIMYFILALFSGMAGSAMSIIIRIELAAPGSQYLHGNNQLFNVLVVGHAVLMIFFLAMPALIGGFGNYILPLMIGATDMSFPRINSIGFWLLPMGLVCLVTSTLVESGAGTGWTVMICSSKMLFDAWKIIYYLLIFILNYIYKLLYVKTFNIINLYACIIINILNILIIKIFKIFNKIMYQRLHLINSIYLINKLNWRCVYHNNDKLKITRWNNIQRLIYNNKLNIIQNKRKYLINKINNISFNINEWLVGITDGDGTFNVYTNINNKKIIFTYKISLIKKNEQLLYKIKDYLKVGTISVHNNIVSFIVRDKKQLINVIIPIFDKNILLTSKRYNYLKFKECLLISNNIKINQIDKINIINKIKIKNIPINYISDAWDSILLWASNISINLSESIYNNKLMINKDFIIKVGKIMTKSWLIGFIEAEGSFYITKKSNNNLINNNRDTDIAKNLIRYCHAFGISQKLDILVLFTIKCLLKINSQVQLRSPSGTINHNNTPAQDRMSGAGIPFAQFNCAAGTYYKLETTNKYNIKYIIEYFRYNDHKTIFLGIKSFEFKVWSRTYNKHKSNYDILFKTQNLIRRYRKNIISSKV